MLGTLGALALAAVAAAGCASSQTSSFTTGAPRSGAARTTAAPTACSRIAVSLAGTQGATGHLELTFALRNASAVTCVLRGYAAAELLDAAGHALPLRVRHGHGFFPDTLPAPRPLALAPGSAAHVGVSFATNDEYAGDHTCRTAATALVRAPGWSGRRWDRVSLRRAPPVAPCGRELVVSPVHA